MKRAAMTIVICAASMHVPLALAGPLDPDCTSEKAARSAATKATVGVGGRCGAKEAATDSAKRAAGVEDKGPVEKRKDGDAGVAKKAVK